MGGSHGHGDETFKSMRTLRIIWAILIAVFAFVIILRLYSWSRGQENLHGILSPLGMIFLGSAQIVGRGNKPVYNVLLVIAMILVFSGLALLFIY